MRVYQATPLSNFVYSFDALRNKISILSEESQAIKNWSCRCDMPVVEVSVNNMYKTRERNETRVPNICTLLAKQHENILHIQIIVGNDT